ncbi:MAG: T9SS type A sorting domain-containing protein [Bacteroidia bacterium]|nr:T9SS type A sorting domain-containing protein [Bacteroidia bacterium]
MKKVLLSIAALATLNGLFGQAWVEDSVTTGTSPNYKNRVFYSLANGEVGAVTFNTRDLEFYTGTPYSASIRINGAFGAQLFKCSGDTSVWYGNIDTTGISTGSTATLTPCIDSDETWTGSAFETGATGHPNYGWGVYNSTTHDVIGNKIFVFKTSAGVWKRIWIRSLGATTSAYTIWVADLDGSNQQTKTISKQGLTSKNFIYYTFATDQTTNDEPDKTTFDLVFTRYVESDPASPNYGLAVTGVLANEGIELVKAEGLPADDADYLDYTLSADYINVMGDKWKELDYSTFQWVVFDSLSYFIKDVPGNIWQLRFTKFVGAGSAKYKFEKRQVGTVSVEEPNSTIPAVALFPNPATDNAQIVFTSVNNAKMQLQVLDMSGRLVLNESKAANAGMNQWQLPLSNLTNGMYIVKLTDGITVKTEKLMIRK